MPGHDCQREAEHGPGDRKEREKPLILGQEASGIGRDLHAVSQCYALCERMQWKPQRRSRRTLEQEIPCRAGAKEHNPALQGYQHRSREECDDILLQDVSPEIEKQEVSSRLESDCSTEDALIHTFEPPLVEKRRFVREHVDPRKDVSTTSDEASVALDDDGTQLRDQQAQTSGGITEDWEALREWEEQAVNAALRLKDLPDMFWLAKTTAWRDCMKKEEASAIDPPQAQNTVWQDCAKSKEEEAVTLASKTAWQDCAKKEEEPMTLASKAKTTAWQDCTKKEEAVTPVSECDMQLLQRAIHFCHKLLPQDKKEVAQKEEIEYNNPAGSEILLGKAFRNDSSENAPQRRRRLKAKDKMNIESPLKHDLQSLTMFDKLQVEAPATLDDLPLTLARLEVLEVEYAASLQITGARTAGRK